MNTIRICGVPEHFNLPWHLADEEGAFADKGLQFEWTDVPEGTGRMAQLLASGQTDLAVILTEGIVKSISEGNPSKIIQTYVVSPLLWGIHTAAHRTAINQDVLEGRTAAISRFGSGSHLMAVVHARKMGWDTSKLAFEVVHTLDGAVDALKGETADYFMWEHFTTKPLVENGTFRWIGDFPTPWPCFVIAAREAFITENPAAVALLLETINVYTREFKQIPSIDRTLSNRYGQQLEDIRLWLSKTQWGQEQLELAALNEVLDQLNQLDLLGEKRDAGVFLWP